MEVTKGLIEKLAKTWLAEAKRLSSRSLCDCGCGEKVAISRARFKPGHDSKLLQHYRQQMELILGS